MSKSLNLQARLLSLLQESLGEKLKIQDYLADELNLSQSSAYRICGGRRALHLDECFQILQAHPEIYLKLNESFSFRNRIQIRVNNFQCEDSFQTYLRSIQKIFSKALTHEKVQLHYTARDLPIFYFLARPRLLDYKYAYWQGTLRDQGPFPLSALTHRLAQEVYELYLRTPSKEIWHPYAYQQQVQLVNSAYQDGSIDFRQYHQLEEELEWVLTQVETFLFQNYKKDAPLKIFDLTEHSMDNGGLLQFDEQRILMSALPVARFFSSSHPDLIQTYRQAFHDHLRRARPISEEGKQSREEWFEMIAG